MKMFNTSIMHEGFHKLLVPVLPPVHNWCWFSSICFRYTR